MDIKTKMMLVTALFVLTVGLASASGLGFNPIHI